MNPIKKIALPFLLSFLLIGIKAYATHIVGGEMTYQCLGDDPQNSNKSIYEITFNLYEDCLHGNPDAIHDDNPTHLRVFVDGFTYDDITLQAYGTFIVPYNFSNECIINIPQICLQQRIFKTTISIPKGKIADVVYQDCCRNNAIVNVRIPGESGAVFMCTINTLLTECNKSATFKNYPPQIICNKIPLVYDHSATDPDGDSLSYEFCTADMGVVYKDWVHSGYFVTHPPPYSSLRYSAGYTYSRPIGGKPLIQINPQTGLITGSPNILGRFVVTVCCHEWRNGVLINTVKRDFQFEVTDCSKAVVADIPQYSDEPNTYVVECKSFTVHFDNTSKGGFAYKWDFGVAGLQDDTSNLFSPTYTYPDTGTYIVKLLVNKGSTCPDSIERLVKIYPYFGAGFTFNGVCPRIPISFFDSSWSSTVYKPNNWLWNFGDGDSAFVQNPQHYFEQGGNYQVVLIANNAKGCIDTAAKAVTVEYFEGFAGNDTIIVKGESINFNASGGGSYTWTPATNLNNPNIGNPTGYYPDTGHYYYIVHITSPSNLCAEDDSINVWVVDQGSLFLPTAFSPNGDGRNDVFKPIAIGYGLINYFRVFNRWGEQVFYSTHMNEGWDGNWKGEPCDVGTYYWIIEATDRFGKIAQLKGDVTLLR